MYIHEQFLSHFEKKVWMIGRNMKIRSVALKVFVQTLLGRGWYLSQSLPVNRYPPIFHRCAVDISRFTCLSLCSKNHSHCQVQ